MPTGSGTWRSTCGHRSPAPTPPRPTCGRPAAAASSSSRDWVAASRRPRYTGYLPYYVAKAGVIALGEALALELAADGILVNTIAPGPILPAASVSEKENAAVIRATPLGRWGGPEPIVQAVLTLLESDFITGETIQVDGGRHVS